MSNIDLPDGVFAATLTPMTDSLEVDREALVAHCRWLLDNGCDGLAPLGSTGEANSFSVAERMTILDHLVGAGIDPGKLMVGTGCCAAPDSIALTRHALAHSVGGVLMLPPFYYKGVSDEGLHAHFDRVIQGVGDDRLRIYLYHFPRMAGVSYSMQLVERLRSSYPGIVVGMKDSSGDVEHAQAVLREFPGMRLYVGTEVYLLDVLEAEGAGCICATTNITCALAQKVYSAWRAGEDARPLQEKLTAVRLALQAHAFVPELKRLLADSTGSPSWRNVRPPFTPLDDAAAREVGEALAQLDFRW